LGQENGECFGFISISSVNSTNFAILGKKFAQFSISQNSKVPVGGGDSESSKIKQLVLVCPRKGHEVM
jgi:hypothetical protein